MRSRDSHDKALARASFYMPSQTGDNMAAKEKHRRTSDSGAGSAHRPQIGLAGRTPTSRYGRSGKLDHTAMQQEPDSRADSSSVLCGAAVSGEIRRTSERRLGRVMPHRTI